MQKGLVRKHGDDWGIQCQGQWYWESPGKYAIEQHATEHRNRIICPEIKRNKTKHKNPRRKGFQYKPSVT